MILVIDRDVTVVTETPTKDYKSKSKGLEKIQFIILSNSATQLQVFNKGAVETR